MTEEGWQRLKNLAVFKVWATDQQMERWLPIVAALSAVASFVVAFKLFVN